MKSRKARKGKSRKGIPSNSRNSKCSRSDRDAAPTRGKGMSSNSGRGIASSSQSSTTLSSGRGAEKGTQLIKWRKFKVWEGQRFKLGQGGASNVKGDDESSKANANEQLKQVGDLS
ncbi:hypothetical protein NL676_033455 [Syzygium grande]|nr:hypothetical protein NL676_033455 [Syzygium grande]